MTKKVQVYIRIEPPIKWPLWFDNAYLDSEDISFLSNDLKSEGFALSAYFESNTEWCSQADCYYWKSSDSLEGFRNRCADYCSRLANELGDGYSVNAITGSVSESGHAEVLHESQRGRTEGVWHPHGCQPDK